MLKHSWLNNAQNVAFLFLSYFDYVMLTYERYQALRAIYIRVPGEPGNEATEKPFLVIFHSWGEPGNVSGKCTKVADKHLL